MTGATTLACRLGWLTRSRDYQMSVLSSQLLSNWSTRECLELRLSGIRVASMQSITGRKRELLSSTSRDSRTSSGPVWMLLPDLTRGCWQ